MNDLTRYDTYPAILARVKVARRNPGIGAPFSRNNRAFVRVTRYLGVRDHGRRFLAGDIDVLANSG
jgi:hypothetical protein